MKKLLNNKGFTLIEMMIVLTIISLLLLIVVPNMTKSHKVASDKTCEATINLLQSQVAAYEADTGNPPPNITVLQTDGYVENVTCPGEKELVIDSDGKVVLASDSDTATTD